MLPKEKRNWEQTIFTKSRVFSENSTKRFFAQAEGRMNNEEMLRSSRRHTIEANIQVIKVAVNDRKVQKKNEKTDLNPKTTLARPPIEDGAYHGKLSAASPGNSVGVTKPSLHSFIIGIKSHWKGRQVLGKHVFRKFSTRNPLEKFARRRNLHQNPQF